MKTMCSDEIFFEMGGVVCTGDIMSQAGKIMKVLLRQKN